MRRTTLLLLLPACLLGLCLSPAPAAESYDNCSGTISALPATVNTQGTWCLKGDLATNITTGRAITVATNNVTIDCNGFKLGGLVGGIGTQATGIHAFARRNVTVRNCNIRGFYRGLYLEGAGGGGHQVEDNLFDGNTYAGIEVYGDGSLVQRNRIRNTGGSTRNTTASGIRVIGIVDVLDNSIIAVAARDGGNGHAYGIFSGANAGGSINGNQVRVVLADGTGDSYGIFNPFNGRIAMRHNDVSGQGNGTGVFCSSDTGILRDSTILGFVTGNDGCTSGGGNVVDGP